jgi:DNA-binding PadR family transcriptional regulator
MTGYELHKLYPKPMRPTIAFIYRALSGMAKEGLVESVRVGQKTRPDRNVFSITEAGRRELDKWLSTPQHFKLPRSTILVQLWFGKRLDKTTLINDFISYRDEIKELLASLEGQGQMSARTPKRGRSLKDEDPHHKLVYESSTAFLGIQIAWLDDIVKKISELPKDKPG